jgi:phage minor structural protein
VSYPILYSPTETGFDNNGFGILSDCATCEVTEEANGIFELYMQYPMDGIHFENIQSRSIIKAKPDQFRNPQLFRVYNISKPNMNGIVNISAQHISYDLSGIAVSPFSAESVALALSGFKANAVNDCPFEFWTDKSTSAKFTVPHPASIRSRLGGVQGSIIDVYGGDYEFDNYTVRLYNNRGMDRGVSIRYGKNLVSLKQDENCQNISTGIYPYWTNQETGYVLELPEKVINVEGDFGFEKIRTVDFTANFQEQPTADQLRRATERYIKNNEIGVPIVSLQVSFAQLQKSEEYKNLQLLERVSLFDTIRVEFPALKVSAKAKAVKIVYNVLLDRVESVALGSVRANIADTIVEQQKQIEQVPTKTDLQLAKEAATAWLTNGKGYKVERRADDGTVIDTLYLDTPDIATAVNVLRIGQSGIGFSHNGVNGPYESAWTIDGKFNADWITSGTLYGLLFKAGVIQSVDGKISIDLTSTSEEPVFNTGISTNGLTIRADQVGSKPLLSLHAATDGQSYYFNEQIYSTSGKMIKRTTESFLKDGTPSGIAIELFSHSGDRSILIFADNKQLGFHFVENGVTKAYFGEDESGEFDLVTQKINNLDVSWEWNDEMQKFVLCGSQ